MPNKKEKFKAFIKTTFTKANIKESIKMTLQIIGILALLNAYTSACISVGENHTTTPVAHVLTQREPKEALTPPTGWDYAYKCNVDYGEFYTYPGENEIWYNRTADGAYYNYSTGTVQMANFPAGLTVNMTFRHSNNPWYEDSARGWYPYQTQYIGSDSTVGTINKFELSINNNTSHSYDFSIDFSSTLTNVWASLRMQNLAIAYDIVLYYSYLSHFFIPSYSSISLKTASNATKNYFDAFYLDDLGVSSAYTAGYNAGYTAGYNAGLTAGTSLGYSSGFNDGENAGYIAGQEIGFSEGYSAGYDDGYIYNETSGGFAQLFIRISDGFASFMEIEILPGITLAGIALFPIVLGLLFLAVKIFKKGE